MREENPAKYLLEQRSELSRLTNLELINNFASDKEIEEHYNGSMRQFLKSYKEIDQQFAFAIEMVKRSIHEGLVADGPLTSPEKSTEYLHALFHHEEIEKFVVIHLNTRNYVIEVETQASGTYNGASIYPREVIKSALNKNAAAIILAHNHPSGDPEPSSSDITLTKRIRDAANLFEIRVLDHLVFGHGREVSMLQRGII